MAESEARGDRKRRPHGAFLDLGLDEPESKSIKLEHEEIVLDDLFTMSATSTSTFLSIPKKSVSTFIILIL